MHQPAQRPHLGSRFDHAIADAMQGRFPVRHAASHVLLVALAAGHRRHAGQGCRLPARQEGREHQRGVLRQRLHAAGDCAAQPRFGLAGRRLAGRRLTVRDTHEAFGQPRQRVAAHGGEVLHKRQRRADSAGHAAQRTSRARLRTVVRRRNVAGQRRAFAGVAGQPLRALGEVAGRRFQRAQGVRVVVGQFSILRNRQELGRLGRALNHPVIGRQHRIALDGVQVRAHHAIGHTRLL